MSIAPLCIAPVVEGHGDELAVPILLRRLGAELIPPLPLDVIKPIRCPRTQLAKDGLLRATQLAVGKLGARAAEPKRSMVLVLADADDDLPCVLAPAWLERVTRADADIVVVLANPEFETWFVAAAESLSRFLRPGDHPVPEAPERDRLKKKWIRDRFLGRYSETVDQPSLTQAMDLVACRRRSPSFDKLCRELERRRAAPGDPPSGS